MTRKLPITIKTRFKTNVQGGNQRDRDRAKAEAAGSGPKKQTGDPVKRREADAKALQEKIAAKQAAKEAGGAAAPTATKGKGK